MNNLPKFLLLFSSTIVSIITIFGQHRSYTYGSIANDLFFINTTISECKNNTDKLSNLSKEQLDILHTLNLLINNQTPVLLNHQTYPYDSINQYYHRVYLWSYISENDIDRITDRLNEMDENRLLTLENALNTCDLYYSITHLTNPTCSILTEGEQAFEDSLSSCRLFKSWFTANKHDNWRLISTRDSVLSMIINRYPISQYIRQKLYFDSVECEYKSLGGLWKDN